MWLNNVVDSECKYYECYSDVIKRLQLRSRLDKPFFACW